MISIADEKSLEKIQEEAPKFGKVLNTSDLQCLEKNYYCNQDDIDILFDDKKMHYSY